MLNTWLLNWILWLKTTQLSEQQENILSTKTDPFLYFVSFFILWHNKGKHMTFITVNGKANVFSCPSYEPRSDTWPKIEVQLVFLCGCPEEIMPAHVVYLQQMWTATVNCWVIDIFIEYMRHHWKRNIARIWRVMAEYVGTSFWNVVLGLGDMASILNLWFFHSKLDLLLESIFFVLLKNKLQMTKK